MSSLKTQNNRFCQNKLILNYINIIKINLIIWLRDKLLYLYHQFFVGFLKITKQPK